jgi:hypothetical protein
MEAMHAHIARRASLHKDAMIHIKQIHPLASLLAATLPR